MFLLCAGLPQTLDLRHIRLLEQRYRSHRISEKALHLTWFEDEYTSLRREGSEVWIFLADPHYKIASKILIWNTASGRLIVTRPWPGYHSIYIREGRDLIVTSHLKLVGGLIHAPHPLPKSLAAGVTRVIEAGQNGYEGGDLRSLSFDGRRPYHHAEAARAARRTLVAAVRAAPEDAVLLLSGGIDSSSLAAAARLAGRSPRTYTFGTSIAAMGAGDISQSDLLAARRVAHHLCFEHYEIIVERKRIVKNAASAVFASELHRGTFVDDAVIYLEVARTLSRAGVRTVLIGEGGDDVFGCFPSTLRFYRGQALQDKVRRDLVRDAPNDYAAIQRIFSLFGIRIFDPFLSPAVVRLGYRLPLDMRIDPQRLMKPVLRRAFAAELPAEIVSREKRVSRDVSGVRKIMTESFGSSRERYLKIFNALFRNSNSAARQAAALSALSA